jgi:hypothetical protein
MTTAPSTGRGALLFVVQASDSMASAVPACGGRSALLLSLDAVQHTLNRLIGQPGLDVAVVACRGIGAAPVEAILPGTTLQSLFLPAESLSASALAGISTMPFGAPHASPVGIGQALARLWLASQDSPARPVVVLLCDGQGTLDELGRLARSLRHLTTLDGRACLAICGYSATIALSLPFFPTTVPELPGPWAAYREAVSESDNRPWMSLNEDPSRLLARHVAKMLRSRGREEKGWTFDGKAGPACEARALTAPKRGNSEAECEDAVACAPPRAIGVAVDGASEGIFARAWAQELARRVVADARDFSSAASLAGWAGQAAMAWRAGFDHSTLPPLYQDKVDEVGAGAALAAVALERIDETHHRWRAAAVGDACLFWVRDGRLLLSFPLARSSEFGISPDLVRTVGGQPVRVVRAEGRGRLGDLYVLGTDAVAQLLLRYAESGTTVGWDRLWQWDAATWQEAVTRWREGGRLANDDSSLLMLKVTG